MKLIKLIFLIAIASLGGCATFTMQVMSRSDGRVYSGAAQKTRDGQGTMQITINDHNYMGTFSRVSSDQYISFMTGIINSNGKVISGNSVGIGGGFNATFTAILVDQNGYGLRCGMEGDRSSGTGAGTCIDAKGSLFDITYRWTGGLF